MLSSICNTAGRGSTLLRLRFGGDCAAQIRRGYTVALGTLVLTACGPRAHIPLRPLNLPDALAPTDSGAVLARRLAPVLYLQRDEMFQLERVVAFLHPEKPVIAYHLLWRDDVHGSWLPFTVPTDEEIIWVGYDSTAAPVEVWSYWHKQILHTKWPRRQVEMNVQWGKHANFPRHMRQSDLPRFSTLNFYYALHFIGLPDILLGSLSRPGPLCFCRSFRRYREYTRPVFLANRIDFVARAEDPRPVLTQVFGKKYSNKDWWPFSFIIPGVGRVR